ncbi:MAG: replication initiator protein A [Alphaproteobacteria bacterium]
MTALFLPERHPVRDFFVIDTLDVAPRSDMASMAHPIFSLSSKPDQRVQKYTHDGIVVEIHPSSNGLATIFDKDVLIYCISKLIYAKNHGLPISSVVRITTHDLLVATNRNTGGIIYQRMEQALDRLAGTRIKTNIATGDEISTQNFGLIEWYDYNRKGSGFAERLRYLDIKLSDWLFRAIDAAEVLPISRDYFRLRRPLDRRIYEVARKHCGTQASWRIALDKLRARTGSKQERKHFAAHMRAIVQTNHLPGYAMTLERDQAVFWRRAERRRGASVAAPAVSALGEGGERRIMVSSRAIESLYEIAPDWDKYMLESMYINWAKAKEPARAEDARFLSWVRSYTKGKAAP